MQGRKEGIRYFVKYFYDTSYQQSTHEAWGVQSDKQILLSFIKERMFFIEANLDFTFQCLMAIYAECAMFSNDYLPSGVTSLDQFLDALLIIILYNFLPGKVQEVLLQCDQDDSRSITLTDHLHLWFFYVFFYHPSVAGDREVSIKHLSNFLRHISSSRYITLMQEKTLPKKILAPLVGRNEHGSILISLGTAYVDNLLQMALPKRSSMAQPFFDQLEVGNEGRVFSVDSHSSSVATLDSRLSSRDHQPPSYAELPLLFKQPLAVNLCASSDVPSLVNAGTGCDAQLSVSNSGGNVNGQRSSDNPPSCFASQGSADSSKQGFISKKITAVRRFFQGL